MIFFIYFSRYETTEAYTRAFFMVIIFSVGSVIVHKYSKYKAEEDLVYKNFSRGNWSFLRDETTNCTYHSANFPSKSKQTY